MYTQDHIDILNEFGNLTTALLARKWGMSFQLARKVLKSIADDYSNVKIGSIDHIYIEGRDILKPSEFYHPKSERKKARIRKISRWKDITKP